MKLVICTKFQVNQINCVESRRGRGGFAWPPHPPPPPSRLRTVCNYFFFDCSRLLGLIVTTCRDRWSPRLSCKMPAHVYCIRKHSQYFQNFISGSFQLIILDSRLPADFPHDSWLPLSETRRNLVLGVAYTLCPVILKRNTVSRVLVGILKMSVAQNFSQWISLKVIHLTQFRSLRDSVRFMRKTELPDPRPKGLVTSAAQFFLL